MIWLPRFWVSRPKLRGLKLGRAGERYAEYLYRKKGCRILDRNYKVYGKKQLGEIDFVCEFNRRIIIVEVKTRSSESFMSLEETINYHKQLLLRRMAKLYVQQNPRYDRHNIQIDIVGILMDPVDNSIKSVRLLENVIEDS